MLLLVDMEVLMVVSRTIRLVSLIALLIRGICTTVKGVDSKLLELYRATKNCRVLDVVALVST